jgi:hypothetical protein
MHPAPLFSAAPLRQPLLRAASTLLLSAFASAHAASDGLFIGGATQWAAIAGRHYTFTPIVKNPSGRALTFGIVNKPSWATLNTKTGQLSGTPTVVATYYNISISVSDGVTTTKMVPSWGIRVYPPNTWDKPMISGTPGTKVTAGSAYAFQPTARDVYAQPMSFSVKNKPAWASFSIATGRVYGTPTQAQTGTYGNIVISATNGELAASLPAFSITVTGGTGSGGATLAWVAPTKNTNGSALTNYAGIRIYYGTSAAKLSNVVQVASPGNKYTIANLAAGTWYFAASAYTTAGTAGAMSSVVSKSIP